MNSIEILKALASQMTQAEIAKAIGVSQPKVHRILSGKTKKVFADDHLKIVSLAAQKNLLGDHITQ